MYSKKGTYEKSSGDDSAVRLVIDDTNSSFFGSSPVDGCPFCFSIFLDTIDYGANRYS